MKDITNLSQSAFSQIDGATDLKILNQLRIDILGKKGQLTDALKQLSILSPEEKREVGAELNRLKIQIEEAMEKKREYLETAEIAEKLAREKMDVTLPTRMEQEGYRHPLTESFIRIVQIFGQMGFAWEEGPDIENDFHNFTALNIPENHSARQEQDTFYLPQNQEAETLVLRTHTSPVQVRTMLKKEPPIAIIAPGRVYRSDYDQTHTPMFHQVEGLVINEKANMAELKGCLYEFCRLYFEDPSLQLRFRPGHFPFTEPSAEVDILWKSEKEDRWLEILGCGMVHPNVLKQCGIDSEKYQGFAFGMGIERITMLKYGIQDLRFFFESDLRWLRHYGFRTEEREIL